jgi:hypothetical protein
MCARCNDAVHFHSSYLPCPAVPPTKQAAAGEGPRLLRVSHSASFPLPCVWRFENYTRLVENRFDQCTRPFCPGPGRAQAERVERVKERGERIGRKREEKGGKKGDV